MRVHIVSAGVAKLVSIVAVGAVGGLRIIVSGTGTAVRSIVVGSPVAPFVGMRHHIPAIVAFAGVVVIKMLIAPAVVAAVAAPVVLACILLVDVPVVVFCCRSCAAGADLPMAVAVISIAAKAALVGRGDGLAAGQLVAAALAVGIARVALGELTSPHGIADFRPADVVALVYTALSRAAGGIGTGRRGCAGSSGIAVGMYYAGIAALAARIGIIVKLMRLCRRTALAAFALLPVQRIVVIPNAEAVGMGCGDGFAAGQLVAAAEAVGIARVTLGELASSHCIADFRAADVVALVHAALRRAAGASSRSGASGGGIAVGVGCGDGLAAGQLVAAALAVGIAGVALGELASRHGIADFRPADVVALVYIALRRATGAGRGGSAGGGGVAVGMDCAGFGVKALLTEASFLTGAVFIPLSERVSFGCIIDMAAGAFCRMGQSITIVLAVAHLVIVGVRLAVQEAAQRTGRPILAGGSSARMGMRRKIPAGIAAGNLITAVPVVGGIVALLGAAAIPGNAFMPVSISALHPPAGKGMGVLHRSYIGAFRTSRIAAGAAIGASVGTGRAFHRCDVSASFVVLMIAGSSACRRRISTGRIMRMLAGHFLFTLRIIAVHVLNFSIHDFRTAHIARCAGNRRVITANIKIAYMVAGYALYSRLISARSITAAMFAGSSFHRCDITAFTIMAMTTSCGRNIPAGSIMHMIRCNRRNRHHAHDHAKGHDPCKYSLLH